MMRIWKFPLEITDVQQIEVPEGSKALSVIEQFGGPTLYVLVKRLGRVRVKKTVHVVGTGNPADHVRSEDFVGTVKTGNFVWHVFTSL